MQRLLSPYAQKHNRRYLREGHLFRGRFYSKRINSTEHLEAAVLYVLMNPVRAGVVRSPEQWRWSSCAATIGRLAAPAFLDVQAALELVDGDPETARRRLEATLHEAANREGVPPSS
jgi:hypothetical protein